MCHVSSCGPLGSELGGLKFACFHCLASWRLLHLRLGHLGAQGMATGKCGRGKRTGFMSSSGTSMGSGWGGKRVRQLIPDAIGVPPKAVSGPTFRRWQMGMRPKSSGAGPTPPQEPPPAQGPMPVHSVQTSTTGAQTRWGGVASSRTPGSAFSANR